MASIKNAQASPNALITNPAGVGPAIVVNCAVVCDTDDAATICSRFIRKGRNACAAGAAKASATPKATARAYSSQMCTRRSQTSMPMMVTHAVRAEAVAIMILRGETRSVSTPPISIRTARGMAPAIRIVPMATAEPVCCKTSHGSATR